MQERTLTASRMLNADRSSSPGSCSLELILYICSSTPLSDSLGATTSHLHNHTITTRIPNPQLHQLTPASKYSLSLRDTETKLCEKMLSSFKHARYCNRNKANNPNLNKHITTRGQILYELQDRTNKNSNIHPCRCGVEEHQRRVAVSCNPR